MATDHEALAGDYALSASDTVEGIEKTPDNALQVATVEALLAIFHQLRSDEHRGAQPVGTAEMKPPSGTAELARAIDRQQHVMTKLGDEMNRLRRAMPDR